MNEEYLKGLHGYLKIEDDYDTWLNAVKDDEEYLKGLHGYLKIDDDYDTWHTAVLGKKKDSTESASTGEEKATQQGSESKSPAAPPVPVPATLKKSMDKFAKTGELEQPAIPSEAAAKPEEKVGGSSIAISEIFIEESAKYRQAQDALLEHNKVLDSDESTMEDLEYSEKEAIRKASEATGKDFTGRTYEEVQEIVNNGKSYAEQVLSENTLERAKELEESDPTIFGLTRTAFWDTFIDKPSRELEIRRAVARGDYETVERLQQSINERANRTLLALDIDPMDERGITETWEDGDIEDAIYKGLNGAANSTGGLLLTIAAPEIGIGYFGTTSYLSTYNQYADRGDLTWEEKESLALISGATEIAVGKLMGGLNNVKRFRQAIGVSDDIGRASMTQRRQAYDKAMKFLDPYAKKFVSTMKNPAVRGASATVYDTASEAIEEGFVDIVNQVAAHVIAGDDYDVYSIYDSMILGAGMGAPMGSVVGYKGFKASNSIYKNPLAEDVDKFEGLQAQYKDLKQALKEEQDPARRKVISEVLGEVRNEITQIKDKAAKAYNKLGNKEAIELYEVNKSIRKLSEQAKAESNSIIKKRLGNKIAGLLTRKAEIETKAGIKAEVDQTVEPTGATEVAATETTQEGARFEDIKAEQDKALAEAQERVSPDAVAKDMLNKRGRYFNKADNTLVEGVVAQDGKTLVIETDEGNIIEIGNIDELGDKPLREIGLTDSKAVISINEDGSFTYNSVAGAAPQGTLMIPSAEGVKAIRRDKNGNIKRVVMKSPDGSQTYNLVGQDAQDVAYQIYLKQMQNESDVRKIESELEKDEEARAIIERAEKAAQPASKTDEATEGDTAPSPVQSDGKLEGGRVEGTGIESFNADLSKKAKAALQSIRSALKLVVPDVKIVIHGNRDTYDQTYDNAKNTKGHFNPNTNTIHILVQDGKVLGENTQTLLRHEAIHPILDAILQFSPEATARAAASARRILNRLGDTPKTKSILKHAESYSGESQEVQDLELLTEFLAVYSESEAINEAKKAMPSFVERVGDMLNRLLRAFNIIDGKTKLEGDREIMALLGNLEFSFATGKAVRPRRHNNIKKTKQTQIRESIDRMGKEPFQPKEGASFEEVHEGWSKSGSNYVIAKNLEHSFELRRMGFVESHQMKDGKIVLGKGISYESYDAGNNVAKIHPKSFLKKSDITESRKKKIADTLSGFSKLLDTDVQFIDNPALGFTSTLIIPDAENGLNEPTPVVNLAYANARTGARGFSTLIVEVVRKASPVTINEVISRMKSSQPINEKSSLNIYGIYQRYANQSAEIDSRKLSKDDREFIALSNVLQESIDRVLTDAIGEGYAEFSEDMQKAFSEVLTSRADQPTAKDSKGEYYIELLPFGEDFVPALQNLFKDGSVKFIETKQRGKELADTLINNLSKAIEGKKGRNSDGFALSLDELTNLANSELDRLNIIDWILIYTQGDFAHPAIDAFLEGYDLPSIPEAFEADAEKLGEFYVTLQEYTGGDTKKLEGIEKAVFSKSDEGLNSQEKYLYNVIQSYMGLFETGSSLFNSQFDVVNGKFKPVFYQFMRNISQGSDAANVLDALNLSSVKHLEPNYNELTDVKEVASRVLGGSMDSEIANLKMFVAENTFEKVSDALKALADKASKSDALDSTKVKSFKNPIDAYNYIVKELGLFEAQEGLVKKITYKELLPIIKRVHGDNLPQGFDIIFNENSILEITLDAYDAGVDVSYGMREKKGEIEYADYPSSWQLGKITMPLVFNAVQEFAGILNFKAVTFSAIANAKSKLVPSEYYSQKELDAFKKRKNERHKRRGLNNLAALRNGKLIEARTGHEVAIVFEGTQDNVVYTTRNKDILSMAARVQGERGNLLTAYELGELVKNKKEVYDALMAEAVSEADVKEAKEKGERKKQNKFEFDDTKAGFIQNVLNKAAEVNDNSYSFESAENIKITGAIASTFENSVKYINPAAIRESKVTEAEAFNAIENMAAAAEQQVIEASKSKKWNWKYLTSRKAWVDRAAPLRKAMANGFSRYVGALMTNRAGATSYADRRFQKARRGIFDKMTNANRDFLNEYIFMRRVIDIDNTWMERKKVYDTRLRDEIDQIKYYESELKAAKEAKDKPLIKEIEQDIKESKSKVKYFEGQVEKYSTTPKHPSYNDIDVNKEVAEKAIEGLRSKIPSDVFEDIEARAEKYFDTYREILQDQYKAGLIDKETRDRFINNDYSPRQFLSKVFGDVDQIAFQSKGLSDAQIQSIRNGSDELIFTDTEYMLDLSFRALENKKAKNKLFSEMDKEGRRKGYDNIADGQFIREGNVKKRKDGTVKLDGFGNQMYEAADKNFVNVYYREDGKLRAFQIHKDYHAQLIGLRGYMLPPKFRKAIKYITGTQIVKATSTALNPFFAITGTIRGFREVTRGRGVYDQYRFLPYANAMLLIDFIKASKDAVLNTELVEEYYAHGGGMSFMTTQGKPDQLYKKRNKIGFDFLQRRGIELNPFKALAFAGEKAELALRLAVYQKTKEQLSESMPDATQEQINFMAAEEARLIADFAQGGELSAEVDLFRPYFNAAIQGTRASYDYARKNPKRFLEKQVQAYMLNTAIAVFSRMMLWDDEEEKDWYSNISPWIAEKYNIIPTGMKNSLGEPVTIRIPKVHQFLMFDSLSEITAKHLVYMNKGMKAPKEDLNPDGDAWFFLESVMSSFPAGEFVPLTEIRQGRNVVTGLAQRMFGAIPTVSFGVSYFGNYDTFRDKIVSYTKGEEMPYAEGYKDGNVHDIYKFFGDITSGLGRGSVSPKRMEVATEKLIGSESTLLTALVYEMTDKFLTVKEETEGITPLKANKEFKNMFGFGKSFIYTIPKDAYREKSDIEQLINMENVTTHNKIKTNIRKAAEKYTLDELIQMSSKKSEQLPKELTDYINSIDEPQIMKKYYLKYFRNIAKGNAVNDDKYFNIKYAKTPKAELELFMHYFGDPAELTDSEKREIQQNLQLIGYSFSEQVKAYYPKMKQN